MQLRRMQQLRRTRPNGGTSGEAVPSAPLGTVNPPDNANAEGGRKRNMPLSRSSSVKRSGRPAATITAVADKPSLTVDYSSATDDQGDMDGYGATDERTWDEMDNEEVQNQYNCTGLHLIIIHLTSSSFIRRPIPIHITLIIRCGRIISRQTRHVRHCTGSCSR